METIKKLNCFTCFICFFFAIANLRSLTTSYANGVCPDEAPSAGVEACDENLVTCGGITVPEHCRSDFANAWLVKEDFPKECVPKTNKECNQPEENCKQPAFCRWENNECKPFFGLGAWTKKVKRTEGACGGE